MGKIILTAQKTLSRLEMKLFVLRNGWTGQKSIVFIDAICLPDKVLQDVLSCLLEYHMSKRNSGREFVNIKVNSHMKGAVLTIYIIVYKVVESQLHSSM